MATALPNAPEAKALSCVSAKIMTSPAIDDAIISLCTPPATSIPFVVFSGSAAVSGSISPSVIAEAYSVHLVDPRKYVNTNAKTVPATTATTEPVNPVESPSSGWTKLGHWKIPRPAKLCFK